MIEELDGTPLPGELPLEDVEIKFVDSFDDILEFKEWLSRRRSLLALDTETDGLNPYAPGARIRLMQFGDQNSARVINCEKWPGIAQWALETATDVPHVWHNVSFDYGYIRACWPDVKFPWANTWDTMLLSRLHNNQASAKLKDIGADLWGRQATLGQEMLDKAKAEGGWDWNTIPMSVPSYSLYSGMDVILTARLYDRLSHIHSGPYRGPAQVEMQAARICADMSIRGMLVDRDYCTEQRDKLAGYVGDVYAALNGHTGINVRSNPQLAGWLQSQGAVLTEKTDKGAWKMDKAVLGSLAAQGFVIADHLLTAKKADKLRGTYFENLLTFSDNRMSLIHPQINTMEARTGRMCLPTDHKLLTRRGVVPVETVRVGDETVDQHGNWVPVTAVHKYDDQDLVVRTSGTTTLTSTAEHRWVTVTERGVRRVEPLTSARRGVVLQPDHDERFDVQTRDIPADTQPQKIAALIGLLVSDGRIVEQGNQLRAYVYQTEGKFLAEMLKAIPTESVMYDRITTEKSSTPHHELRIKAKWLRPVLTAAGLTPELTTGNQLLKWVLRSPDDEVRAFLSAVWLADGTTAHPQNGQISCEHAAVRDAVQAAAYRLGLRSRVLTEPASSWGTKPRMSVKLLQPRPVWTRFMETSTTRSDVWCVSTTSGTFTAWGDDGPYLTGNSVTQPALQTLPSREGIVRNAFIAGEGRKIVTCDFSQIEMRLTAHLSKDPALIAAFKDCDATGDDFFTRVGRDLYGAGFVKSDPRRTLIKNVMYGSTYGAGVLKMSESAKVPLSVMTPIADDIFRRFVGVKGIQTMAQQEAEHNQRNGGIPYIHTANGVRLIVDPDRLYSAANYAVQGLAASEMKKALINITNAGLGEYLNLVVHDEVICTVPEEDVADVQHMLAKAMTITEAQGFAVQIPAEPEAPTDRWEPH